MMIYLCDESATLAFAKRCAAMFQSGGLIFLQGTLGAGKTTFSRGLIQALGHTGAVKSPTYTLVETYVLGSLNVCHFDLYRLADPEELEFIGIREYLNEQALCLVEWAENGHGILPPADLTLTLTDQPPGRCLTWLAGTRQGEAWVQQLNLFAQEITAQT